MPVHEEINLTSKFGGSQRGLTYLCEEHADALIRRTRPQLHSHLSAILQETVVDVPEPSPAKNSLESICYHTEFIVGEPAVLKWQ